MEGGTDRQRSGWIEGGRDGEKKVRSGTRMGDEGAKRAAVD